ncbi:MAG: DNA primase [Gemmatimonadales bacterium]|nr:MAG: DNA primase [Gemmatimonadales bacterium]
MIPDDVVEEVRARADLVEIIGEVVELKRSGKQYKGKCPFHEDRTPSFYVTPDQGFYKCFGCDESGDVFSFVMKRMGMDFPDAIRYVGERSGVEVREVAAGDEGREDPFRAYYEANAFARKFFQDTLADPATGADAREYLRGRGIDDETRERFGIGFAPDEWGALRSAAEVHGIARNVLVENGLLVESERAPEPYDRFRNRIIFPIEAVGGRIVGFGGRILGVSGKGAPKYLNSPEGPVYHKGEILYALGWNRHAIRKEETALLVEGYMDVVALSAGGVNHAVGVLGTSLTAEQARLLKRYTRRVLLLFDSDEAGLRATFRGADVLLAAGIHPSVVTLPAGEDPDSVIRSEGRAGLERYLDQAVDVIDRKLQLLEEKGFLRSLDRKRTAVDKLLPTLRATADETLRDMYVTRVAEKTGVRRDTLEREIESTSNPAGGGEGRSALSPGRGAGSNRGHGSGSGRPGGRLRHPPPDLGAERQLLLVLLQARDWLDRALERIGPGEFQNPVYQAIFQALVDEPELTAPPPEMAPEAVRTMEQLLGHPEELEHTQRVFEESIARLRSRSMRVHEVELRKALSDAGSPEEERELLEQLQRLRKDRPGRWNVVRRERPAD